MTEDMAAGLPFRKEGLGKGAFIMFASHILYVIGVMTGML